MRNYIIAGFATLALPWICSYIAGKLIPMLMAWQLGKVKDLLGVKTGDAALDQFERDLVMALVRFAQARFPADGLGPERKKMVVDFLCAKVPFFKGQQDRLSALIDKLVASEAEMLDKIQPAVIVASNPDQAVRG